MLYIWIVYKSKKILYRVRFVTTRIKDGPCSSHVSCFAIGNVNIITLFMSLRCKECFNLKILSMICL